MRLSEAHNHKVIRRARIVESHDGNEVHVTLEDGTQGMLIRFYPDEIRFGRGEFIGRTVAQARDLKLDREMHWMGA